MKFEAFIGGTYQDGLASFEDCLNRYPSSGNPPAARTGADEEAGVIVFEPASTRNTDNVIVERFTAPMVCALSGRSDLDMPSQRQREFTENCAT